LVIRSVKFSAVVLF